MAEFKSEKKGSNIICRVSNATPEMVCRYVQRLPKHKMTEENFRDYMGPKWFQNEHQAPEQWGLYYIDGENYYPRFDRDITLEEAERYLYGWMKRLIVINPYTRFKVTNDSRLVESIVKQLELNPDEHDLKTIIRNIINSDEPFIVNDIIANALNNYSEVLKVQVIDKDNEKFTVSLLPNYKEILKTKYNMTKKEYFDSFSDINTSAPLNEPNQVIYFGAPGTGKSHTVKGYTKDLPEGNVFRTTFHPDSDYSTFVGSYKPSMKPATNKQTILDYDSLVDKFKEYLAADTNITRACTQFGYDYHDSIVKMQENNAHTIPALVADAYKSGTTYDTQVRSGMSVYETSYRETGNDEKIIYRFTPQAFTKAYIRAWQTNEPVFLVIEEINRGNCAQIFGDLFQLLDRKNNISEYPIKPDHDLGSYINEQFKKHGCIAPEDSAIFRGDELCLPANLYIWATMNTSDQSLFPIDSAFKRRWEWRYIKIAKPLNKETNQYFDWKIEGETNWWEFLKQINRIINKMTNSADKQLGYFFAKADDAGIIKYDRFVAKVCFYLWNDIFKTFAMDDVETDLFKFKYTEDGQEKVGKLNFTEFFDENGKVVPVIVQQFIDNVMSWNDKTKQE